MSCKAKFQTRWYGPYHIAKIFPASHSYRLKELSGEELSRSYQGSMLKKFVKGEDGWWASIDDDYLLVPKKVVYDGRKGDLVEATEAGQYSSDEEAPSQLPQRKVQTPGEAVRWTRSVAKESQKVDIGKEGMIVADTSGSTVKMPDNGAIIVKGR
ncbi:unnamed protein product [Clonostachys rosea f. rosea IK726]|uniref:Uncharacterized protein n=1 Tax=Clonostachys rosea f. rosea IK726 TaxID=1349383 RepID=A0ACA9UR82_BIOOC|nr:unnamed protein product [Clonostachys rosea f. rosea IK726]